MKLIDVLLRELPKHGGWPVGVGDIEMLSDGAIYFDGDEAPESFKLPQCDDGWNRLKSARDYSNAVTREQYEAALAASKTEWDGAFPIPAGTEVEVHFEGDDSRVWTQFRVEYMRGEIVVLYDYRIDSVDAYNNKTLNFRPIHSEADKKRYAAIEALFEVLDAGVSTSQDSIDIYDAITAGKIPHIRIE